MVNEPVVQQVPTKTVTLPPPANTSLESIETPPGSDTESPQSTLPELSNRQETGRDDASIENLPIKASSGVAAAAAAMMKERDALTERESKRPQ